VKQTPILVLLLPVLAVLAVYFWAFALFVTTSFLHQVPGTAMTAGPANWHNYTTILSSDLAQWTFFNTLVLSCEVTILATGLGYPLAYLMARSADARTRNLILFVLIVSFLSGGITRAYAWMIILGNNGPINRTLRSLGLDAIRLINNGPGVVISLVHFVIPFFVLTLTAAIKNVPTALEEAARNLGGSRWRAFLAVTFPLSFPGLLSAILLTLTVTLSSFLFPLLLGGGRVQMVANLIYDKMLSSFDMPAASAMSMLFLLFSLIPLCGFAMIRLGLSRRLGGGRR
jgi:putative spermidine/putrescine transport system permease protein